MDISYETMQSYRPLAGIMSVGIIFILLVILPLKATQKYIRVLIRIVSLIISTLSLSIILIYLGGGTWVCSQCATQSKAQNVVREICLLNPKDIEGDFNALRDNIRRQLAEKMPQYPFDNQPSPQEDCTHYMLLGMQYQIK